MIVHVNATEPPAVGDTVTYADVNLWDNRGTLLARQPGERGGDCVVRWARPWSGTSEECIRNLRRVTQ
jgi:hypothetical protein